MKGIFCLSLVLLLVVGSWSCSLPPGTLFYTITQRTVLAPLVIHGTVLNISTPARVNVLYKACVEVIQVIKGRKNLPNIVCFGTFGPDYLCKTDVYDGVDYIFFLDDDLKTRYEVGAFPQAAFFANPQRLDMAKQGVCDPSSRPTSTCVLPRVKPEGLDAIKRIREGQSLLIPCGARGGTQPSISIWSKRGSDIRPPSFGNSLQLLDATMSDMGTYVCTIYNPAGHVSEKLRVFVVPEPCGAMIALKTNANARIKSPKYPRRYPGDKMCSWRICPAAGQRVALDFKDFNLLFGDSVQIHHECDPNGGGKLRYCSKASPGKIVSRCTSSCIQFWFISRAKRNYKATGFLADVSSTDGGTTIYDYGKLYCDNPILIRFIPKIVYVSEVKGEVLFNYKQTGPSKGEKITISVRYESNVGLFGCSNVIKENMEYYVGASQTPSNQYLIRFFMLTDSNKKPIMFDKYMNEYKDNPPACRSPTTLPQYTGLPTPPRPNKR